MATPAAERRRALTYPDTHPAGWYHLLDSDDLDVGQVRPVSALGLALVLFRTASGQVHALDAHCPHLGAHLGVGGTVVGECIQCPFHRWRFRGDGQLDHIPYEGRTPSLGTHSWTVYEAYGLIFAWLGPPDTDGRPPYFPDLWREIDTDRYRRLGRYAPRDVAMHLWEFAENSVDLQHFDVLHRQMRFPWSQWVLPGIEIHHKPSWYIDPHRPHVAHLVDDAHVIAGGKPLPWTRARGDALFLGPASVVVFRVSVPDIGDVLIIQTHTPLGAADDPLCLQVRFTWFAELQVNRWLVWYIVGNWVSQWWQDISIWENKIHRPKPFLVKGDGPVHQLRQWFRQFYDTPAARDLATGGRR